MVLRHTEFAHVQDGPMLPQKLADTAELHPLIAKPLIAPFIKSLHARCVYFSEGTPKY